MKSWLEISGARLANNFRAVRSVVGAEVEVLGVIKANAYGHGATLCAPLLVEAGARWLGVTDAEEGAAVRAALGESNTRLLVMCGMEPREASAIVLHDMTPVIWTMEHVVELEKAARRIESRCSVHVEIDSGMSRQGVAPGPELAGVLELLAKSEWITCEGMLSHLCCSEAVDAEITRQQRDEFAKALQQARRAGVQPEFVHLGNTSAVDEGSTMPWIKRVAKEYGASAMVRTGIAMYGHCLELEEASSRRPELLPKLQSVMSWKTRVIGVRDIEAGTTVGYGATFIAARAMRLALLPVGYADGFRREASSGVGDGWVMIAGQRAPVVGRVSMNLTTVDVTAIDGVAIGDQVTLLGEGVSAEDHARWCGTIPYDVLCGVKGKRVVV